MRRYEKKIVIDDPRALLLNNLPFSKGEKVTLVITSDDGAETDTLKDLFAKTQALPQVQALSEQEIAEEIALLRNGK